MKKLFIILAITAMVACSPSEPQTYVDYHCREVPEGVPTHYEDTGVEVIWDCTWEASWREGNVTLHYNADGEFDAMSRTVVRVKGNERF